MTKLQTCWKNPIDGDWDFIKDWSDEELKKQIEDDRGQIKLKKVQLF